ncbi:MAG: hypothetical protein LBC74_05625 [Planctomycetaceae bacterium]|jgi:hypothetical protein|nr:hypothetical protein [Planctomycetaceae bacterium]
MNNSKTTNVLTLFRRRLIARLFWKNTIIVWAIFLFLWGTLLLTFRVSGFVDVNTFFMILLALVILPLFALFTVSRRIPSNQKLISLIDKENGAGGLVMSSFETDIGNWSEQIKELNIPDVHWIPNRTIGLFLAAILFAIASLLLPVSVVSDQLPQKLNIYDQVSKLTTQLDTLKEEKILDQVEVQSLKRDLKMLQKEADGLGPIKTFDALDTLAGRMNHEVAKTVQDAERNVKSLAEAESLVRKVTELSEQHDAQTSKALMEGLAESMENMFAENRSLAESLKNEVDDENDNESADKKIDKNNKEEDDDEDDENTNDNNKDEQKQDQADEETTDPENQNQNEQNNNKKSDKNDNKKNQKDALKESLKKMLAENNMRNLSPEQMQKLSRAMQKCAGKCERQIENLQNAGFPIDKDALKKLAESKREAKAEAERMLSELWANCDCEGGEGNGSECEGDEVSPRYTRDQDWRTDPNAKEGKNRFKKTADEDGFDYKAEELPLAELQAFKDSLKMGITTETPTKNLKRKTELNGGAISETSNGTGSAHMQQIYPVHRKPVGRFFEK